MTRLMTTTRRITILSAAAALLCVCTGCSHNLRGSWKHSKDGNTYLAVAEVDGGGGGRCDNVFVDKKLFPHPIGAPHLTTPGKHTISCNTAESGSEIGFEIPAGVIYRFDYWGP